MNAKEEDSEQYLKNLGIEYRFGCFSEKRPEVCHLLGDFFEAIHRDFDRAAKIYKSNCDDYKFARSCHKYGNYAFVGRGGVKQSMQTALEYYAKGCDLNYGDSCFNAGLLCAMKNPLSPNPLDVPRGVNFLRRACELDNNQACYHLSGMYIAGTSDGTVLKDMAKAFEFSVRACDLGNIYSCANVSQMYKRGEGVEVNPEKAAEYRARAEDMERQMKRQSGVEFQQGLD